jgi:hypothetical protein
MLTRKKTNTNSSETTKHIKSFGIISINTGQSSFNEIVTLTLDKETTNKFNKLNNMDIIIIGLQEDNPNSGSTEYFQQKFNTHQLIKEEFIKGLVKLNFVRIKIIVLSKIPLKKSEIKVIKICDNSSCLIGRCCSKGLVAIKIDDTLLINNHLPFKPKELETGQGLDKRIKQMNKLYEAINKKVNRNLMSTKKNKHKHKHKYNSRTRSRTNSFKIILPKHNIIWFGDLNFRVDPNDESKTPKTNTNTPTMDKYKNLINDMTEKNYKYEDKRQLVNNFKQSMKQYLEKDQLIKLQSNNKNQNTKKNKENYIPPFKIYENKIRFTPTCKLEEGTKDIYEVFSKNQPRIPSWCDRIIFNENTKNKYKITYDSLFFPIKSDHLAVFGTFIPRK